MSRGCVRARAGCLAVRARLCVSQGLGAWDRTAQPRRIRRRPFVVFRSSLRERRTAERTAPPQKNKNASFVETASKSLRCRPPTVATLPGCCCRAGTKKRKVPCCLLCRCGKIGDNVNMKNGDTHTHTFWVCFFFLRTSLRASPVAGPEDEFLVRRRWGRRKCARDCDLLSTRLPRPAYSAEAPWGPCLARRAGSGIRHQATGAG